MTSLVSILALAVSCTSAVPTPAASADAAPDRPPADAPPSDGAEGPDPGDGDGGDGDRGGDGDGAPDAPDKPDAPDAPDEPEEGDGAKKPEPEPKPEPPPPVQREPAIEATEPTFINGDVPKVEKFLEKQAPRVAACVLKHGGLTEADGLMKMQFLVRLRGRAEGVEVLASRGVTDEAQRCARKALKNEWVGTPTADPTGVQFTYRLKRRLE